MKLCIKARADDRAKDVFITGNDSIVIDLFVQNGTDKENFVGQIELQYRDDVTEFGNSPTEEFQPDMNEWTITYKPRIDAYTKTQDVWNGHVYPATNKTANRKRGK